MSTCHILYLSKLSLIQQVLHIKILSPKYSCFHKHILFLAFYSRLNDIFQLLNTHSHRDCTPTMFSCLQSFYGKFSMRRRRCNNVDCIYCVIFQHVIIIIIAILTADSKFFLGCFNQFQIRVSNRYLIYIRMLHIDRNKLHSKAYSNHSNLNFIINHTNFLPSIKKRHFLRIFSHKARAANQIPCPIRNIH